MASICRRLLAFGAVTLLGGCDALQLSVMNAAGPIAENQRHLYIIVAIVLIFVALPVILLTPLMAWHYRLSNKNNAFRPKWNFSWILEAFIWIPPTAIVVGLSILLWDYTHRLDPYRPIASAQPAVEIQAVALDWKWLFIYPDEHVATINQLAIPIGRAVHITLTSGTVMQSLYIPRLAGQIYAMAGMQTQLNLEADRTGVYRGENVQYNGDGFQNQSFLVLALPPADYQNWIGQVRQTNRPLDETAYAKLFERSTLPQPVLFSGVREGLFQRVLAHAQASGAGAPQ
jgi:cytochrome o ubiquinol oxidase subunit 2